MVDLTEDNFVRKELSKTFLEGFLEHEKLRNACLKYVNGKVDIEAIEFIVQAFLENKYDLEESMYAYLWLISKKQYKQNLFLQEHYRLCLGKWFNDISSINYAEDSTSDGFTAYDVYTSGEDFPFNIRFKRIYNSSDIKFMLNIFGQSFIPNRVIKVLEENDIDEDYAREFNDLIMLDLVENPSFDCDVFSTYVPNGISEYNINILANCSGLLYSSSHIDLGCIIFDSLELSNFLKRADSIAINELLSNIDKLISYIDVGMASVSNARVISKHSPLWDFYKNSYSFNGNVEFIVVASYFIYDIAEALNLKHFLRSDLDELDYINVQLYNLLKL